MHDGDLLKQFVTGRSQAAIRQLVDRYQDVVHSVAWRQIGNATAAEDIAQQVFLILVRKAHWLTSRPSLAGWLHRCTLNRCARHLTSEYRRQKREKAYSEDGNTGSKPMRDNQDVLRQLDAELNSLPAKEREAIVLRFYQGQSLREVGETLGTTEEAARKRVSRGMDRLSSRLRKKGMTVAAATLLASLMTEGVRAAPAGFAANTMTAAAGAGLLGKATLASTIVAHATLLTKTQVAAIVALAASVPVGLQWRKIQQLSEENNRLAAGPPSAPDPRPARIAFQQPVNPASSQRTETVAARPSGRGSDEDSRAARADWPPRNEDPTKERRESLERAQRIEIRVAEAASRLSLSDAQAAQLQQVLLDIAIIG